MAATFPQLRSVQNAVLMMSFRTRDPSVQHHCAGGPSGDVEAVLFRWTVTLSQGAADFMDQRQVHEQEAAAILFPVNPTGHLEGVPAQQLEGSVVPSSLFQHQTAA